MDKVRNPFLGKRTISFLSECHRGKKVLEHLRQKKNTKQQKSYFENKTWSLTFYESDAACLHTLRA
jgi:hypothetical protein